MNWEQLPYVIAVAFFSGVLGGGLIDAYLNWRRFRREEAEIKKEEQRIAIDPIKSVVSSMMWEVRDYMSDKLQLYVLKSHLEGSVQEYDILAEFVLTNLTDSEVIITRIEVEEPGLPPLNWTSTGEDHKIEAVVPAKNSGVYITPNDTEFRMYDTQAFYEWESKAETSVENVTLVPRGTLKLAYVAVRRFCAIRRLSTLPEEIAVTVHSTGKHKVTEILELAEGHLSRPYYVDKYPAPKGSVEALLVEQTRIKAAARTRMEAIELPEEGEEIPF